jgi:DNA polymerase-3 subunit epsilon
MREIVLDTETTGLDPGAGDRVVEVACLELVNHVPTGTNFQRYVNPERDMPAEAVAVHGLSEAFLAQHPVFAQIAETFLEFVADAPLIIHNAAFDVGFLNAELDRIGRPGLESARAIDTVELARRKQPGAPANLDALCRRFGIDNSGREKHGALLDAELLAEVYLELSGGRQPALGLQRNEQQQAAAPRRAEATARPPREHGPNAEELADHAEFVDSLDTPVWRR